MYQQKKSPKLFYEKRKQKVVVSSTVVKNKVALDKLQNCRCFQLVDSVFMLRKLSLFANVEYPKCSIKKHDLTFPCYRPVVGEIA